MITTNSSLSHCWRADDLRRTSAGGSDLERIIPTLLAPLPGYGQIDGTTLDTNNGIMT